MSIKDWLKNVSLKTTLQNYEQSPLFGKGLVLIVIKGSSQAGFGFKFKRPDWFEHQTGHLFYSELLAVLHNTANYLLFTESILLLSSKE